MGLKLRTVPVVALLGLGVSAGPGPPRRSRSRRSTPLPRASRRLADQTRDARCGRGRGVRAARGQTPAYVSGCRSAHPARPALSRLVHSGRLARPADAPASREAVAQGSHATASMRPDARLVVRRTIWILPCEDGPAPAPGGRPVLAYVHGASCGGRRALEALPDPSKRTRLTRWPVLGALGQGKDEPSRQALTASRSSAVGPGIVSMPSIAFVNSIASSSITARGLNVGSAMTPCTRRRCIPKFPAS
jgi:hypothetical protein